MHYIQNYYIIYRSYKTRFFYEINQMAADKGKNKYVGLSPLPLQKKLLGKIPLFCPLSPL